MNLCSDLDEIRPFVHATPRSVLVLHDQYADVDRSSFRYLKKPPFRFLHDALTETIRATGFGQGTPSFVLATRLSTSARNHQLISLMLYSANLGVGELMQILIS